MALTSRDCNVIIFALEYLKSNLDEVENAFSEPGVHPTIPLPVEVEISYIIAKIERDQE